MNHFSPSGKADEIVNGYNHQPYQRPKTEPLNIINALKNYRAGQRQSALHPKVPVRGTRDCNFPLQ
jgi:hypothetical protein